MNKATLVEIVAESAGIKKKEADAAVSAVFTAIENELATGGKVQIAGFGSFKVKERSERMGRNPKTKEEIKIPASKVPAFVAGKTLKESVNK
ncbi:MAG: HU family DNA-binding protein [Eubacteriales bacterium]|nr:HU family DNA-binding protein [Eubacteriales bacterium]MDD4421579.1 HU family DNA-binding protein [Eubacteriales bacterium]HBR31958.1 integration host factor subunit alpha [Clostridiales bacterium]